MTLYQHAQRHAAQAFHVFPLIEQQKLPLIEDFPNRASRDEVTLAQWWNADMGAAFTQTYNVGISTSRYGDDPAVSLCVIDVDNKNEKRGSESVLMLEFEGIEFPATYTQDTPTGGQHLVYWTRTPVRNLVDRDGKGSIGRGLDIRGVGGFIVGSGSVTEKGAYTDNGLPVVEAPAALIERILQSGGAPIERSASTEMPANIDATRATERAIDYLRHAAPEAIDGSGGDATTFKVAAQLKDLGVPEADALELLMEHWFGGCGWASEDLATKIANAYRYGKQAPGSAAPESQFAPVAVAAEAPLFTLENAAASRYVERDPPVMRWCVESLVPAGRTTGLVAAGGTGKSLLTIQMAIAKATGRPFLDRFALKPGGVLLVANEDDNDELHRRVFRAARAHGIGPAELHRFFAISRVGENSRLIDGRPGELLPTMFARRLVEAARQIPNLELIILDPASRLRGGDENSAPDATALVEALERVASGTGAAVLVVHHTPKSAASARDVSATAARGSSAFTDGLRSQIVMRTMTPDGRRDRRISPERAANLVELVLAKANYSAPLPPVWLQRGAGGLLSIVDLDAEAAQRRDEPDDLYAEVIERVCDHLAGGRIESRRSLEREHGGKDGKFRISAHRLRAILSRAVDAGDLEERQGAIGGKVQAVLALPTGEAA